MRSSFGDVWDSMLLGQRRRQAPSELCVSCTLTPSPTPCPALRPCVVACLCSVLLKALAAQVQRDHDAVKKDNDFIYNDLVPKLDTLESIPKMALAKPVQFPSPSPNFVDVFTNLLPTDVYQAVSAYNAKRDEIVSGELKKLQDATQSMNRCGGGKGSGL